MGRGNGWADVWYKGHFAFEYKGPGRSLAAAYEQLLQYRESLESPPLLVTGNTQELHIHTNFTNSTRQVVTVAIDAAVFDAYGWPHGLSDEGILARLLALNLERAKANSTSWPQKNRWIDAAQDAAPAVMPDRLP